MPDTPTPKTPTPAATPKRCPECNADLKGRDPIAHSYDHWPKSVQDKDLGADALARRKILEGM